MSRMIWGGVVGLLTISLLFTFKPDSFETNIFSLLPEESSRDEQTALPQAAIDHYSEKLSRKVILLVAADNDRRAIENSRIVYLKLSRSGIFSEIRYRFNEQQLRSIYNSYHDYRFGLLAEKDRQGLSNDPEKWLADKLVQSLVSPVAGVSSDSLKSDPFGLYRDFLSGLPIGNRKAQLIDGYTFFHANNASYILITAELKDSAFGQKIQTGFSNLMQDLQRDKKLYDRLLVFGVIRYALANRLLAQQEMSFIGTGSLLGIILIFYLVFRRFLLLGVVLLPVAVGLLSALAVNLLLFGQLHLVSLVFGVSLIGVSIDYTLHFCCSHSDLADSHDPDQALARVKTALTIGLITSSLGYLTLSFTDFPALRQMALLAIVGLTGAYFTVLFWVPALLSKPLVVHTVVMRWTTVVSDWLHARKAIPVWSIVVLLAIGLIVNYQIKNSRDDIKIMSTRIGELEAIDHRLQAILGEFPNSQFFLVRGKTAEAVLETEHALTVKLRGMGSENGRIYGLSDWLPDKQIQQENLKLIRAAVINNAQLDSRIRGAGLPVELIDDYRQHLTNASERTLDIETFIASPVGRLHSHLWLGKLNESYYSIVSLFGFKDLEALNDLALADSNLYFIDRAAHVSSLFEKYRGIIEKMFPFVILVIFVLLSLRFGVRASFRVVSAPLISAMFSFLVTNIFIGQYNLFSIFGLVITVAVAIDYAVFIRESSGDNRSTYLAITLAGLTTLLALGLLSLSHTPALSSFGMSLLFGILFSYVLTPLIVKPKEVSA